MKGSLRGKSFNKNNIMIVQEILNYRTMANTNKMEISGAVYQSAGFEMKQ